MVVPNSAEAIPVTPQVVALLGETACLLATVSVHGAGAAWTWWTDT